MKGIVALIGALVMVVVVIASPALAVESVSERQARKKLEAQRYPNQANEALNKNEPDRAIELFTKAIGSGAFNNQPNTMGDIYFGRGNAYRKKGDCISANADYTKALEFIQKGDFYFFRAACSFDLKQDVAALADLDAAIKVDPDATLYRGVRCIFLFNRKDFAVALPDCEKALAAQPQDKGLLTATALAAEQTGNQQRAAELYRQLLAVDPGNPIATDGLRRTG